MGMYAGYYNPRAVIVTHLPTNIRVECGSQHSQHRNKALAIQCMKAKLVALFGKIPTEGDFKYEVGNEIPLDTEDKGEDNDKA